MTLKLNGAANAGEASDKAPKPAMAMVILSTMGLRDIKTSLFFILLAGLDKAEPVPRAYGCGRGGGGGGGLP